ncbi:DNA-binding protein [Shewanella sp. D64]|uniref:DNA-binding protein n=1 Tax=unclassified Shewanella TaxID=196818 RepID=UPI0022BA4514|nr:MULTISPECIES: DNA-binding protein [unclassified Shewanella]MEC4727572.1 DNA-binding protein [Shewanella sp. D64]MEC4739823.1 DNA-binding protein [Shewanella sp. E94]WBJ98053.1 DNA-binding protein [Shewanella sp. MTB7]
MKSWLICIDDTDDIGTKGTGEIAEEIACLLSEHKEQRCWVTRHQLFVHPDIPYTSHNSAMCFQLQSRASLDEIKQIAVTHLLAQSAPASDPGLAIIALDCEFDRHALIEFGLATKKEVKTKEQAYELAERLGVDLSEHGGTGQGVIGALAGLGLRLYGQDGRVKGQINLGQEECEAGIDLSVGDLLKQTGMDIVINLEGEVLDLNETVHLSQKIKAVYCRHQFALLVYRHEQRWCNALKKHLKAY